MAELPDREIFWNVGYPLWGAVVYVLIPVALAALGLGIYREYRLVRLGRPNPDMGPWRKRIRSGVSMLFTDLFAHRRFLKRELYPGIMHMLIVWGALALLLAAAIDAVEVNWHKYIASHVGFEIPTTYVQVQLGFVWDVVGGGLLTAGLGMALYRRLVIRPERLNTVLDDGVILGLIALLVLTGFVLEGLRIGATQMNPASAMYKASGGWSSPVGYAFALLYRGAGATPYGMEVSHFVMWWLHVLIMTGGLIYFALRPTKLSHMLWSPLNAFLKPDRHPGALRRVEYGEDAAQFGAQEITDFTWKQLLDCLACTDCGRCQDRCPAYGSGRSLSPRKLIQDLRAYLYTRGPQLLAARGGGREAPPSPHMVHDVVTSEVLWSCVACRACTEACPVMVEHIDAIVEMRRWLVGRGEVDKGLQEALTNLGRYGNSFGQSARNRERWARPLDFEVKDASREPVDYLWFVGDYASYDPGIQEATRSVARLFHRAGLDFGILGRAERNSGNDVRRAGEEGLFEALAEENIAALGKASFQRIVTTDPHSFNALKNEYGAFGGHYRVLHYTQVLDELLREGKLEVQRELPYRVTYHDPCYLGRYNGIYEEPRRVLGSLGLTLVEMPRNREASFCCGAGGGCIWMEEDASVKERPSEARVREAVSLDVDYLVTTCPKDISMFRDAVKTTGNEERLQVKDLAELVEEACCGDASSEGEAV